MVFCGGGGGALEDGGKRGPKEIQALRTQKSGSTRRCLIHGYLRERFMKVFLHRLGQVRGGYPSRQSTLALELEVSSRRGRPWRRPPGAVIGSSSPALRWKAYGPLVKQGVCQSPRDRAGKGFGLESDAPGIGYGSATSSSHGAITEHLRASPEPQIGPRPGMVRLPPAFLY